MAALSLALSPASASAGIFGEDKPPVTGVLEKSTYTRVIGDAAAKCDKKSLLTSWGDKFQNTFQKFSISGKEGPQIACIKSIPVELQAGEAAGKVGLGSAAGDKLKSVREMTEYTGRDREQLVTAPGYKAYVEARLREIETFWPANAPPPAVPASKIQVYISNTAADNALAFIDDSVVVSTGLIDQVGEDEFLFVLAHEYVHIVAQHNRKDQARYERRKFVRFLGQSFNVVDYFSATSFSMNEQNKVVANTDAAKFTKATGKVEAAKSQLIYINDVFINPGWSRGLEDEADAVAMDILLNRDPNRADFYLKYFSDTSTGDEAKKSMQSAMIRLYGENMQEALELNRLVNEDGSADPDTWLKSVNGNIQNGLRMGLTDFLTRSHIADKERKKGLMEYVERAYGLWPAYVAPEVPAAPPAATGKKGKSGGKSTGKSQSKGPVVITYEDVRNGPEVRNLIALRQSVEKFLAARATGDEAATKLHLGEIEKNPGRDQAYVHYELWHYYDQVNNRKMADLAFSKMLSHPFSSARIYADAARSLAVRGKTAEARALAEKGGIQFNDKDRFVPVHMYIAYQSKDAKTIATAWENCQRTNRAELIQACEVARSDFEKAEEEKSEKKTDKKSEKKTSKG